MNYSPRHRRRDAPRVELPSLDAIDEEISRRRASKEEEEKAERDILLGPARTSLIEFTGYTNPRYQAGWFARRVAHELDVFLEKVIRGESPRLMLFAPPRHGKSELVSRRFPAYALGRHPDLSFIATSYAAELAARMNRDVQRIIDTPAYGDLFPETSLWGKNVRANATGSWMRNSDMFEVVGQRGSYRSAGVGGGITGMGADIGVIDDPFKDAQQANSPVTREAVWEWYQSTLYSRVEAGGGLLIILTRWHQDDLAGRLIAQQEAGDGDDWRIVSFPAVCDEVVPGDPRQIGEALHPERFSAERLARIKKAVGAYYWSALYQQNPTPKGGTLFQVERIGIMQTIPAGDRKTVRAWDFGASVPEPGKDPDYTVGVKMSRLADGRVLVEDVVRGQWSAWDVETTLKATTEQDGFNTPVRIPQDPAQAGKDQAQRRTALLAGYQVEAKPVTGDKEIRATPLAAQVEAGNVLLLFGSWNQAFIDELRAFPSGKHDDQVDAAADAFNKLTGVEPGENLMEYYRQEAERLEKERQAEAPIMHGADPVPDGVVLIPLIPREGCNSVHGVNGDHYTLRADGRMYVKTHDVGPLLKAGFRHAEEQPLTC